MKKRKNWLIILIIVLAVVLIGGGLGLIVRVYQSYRTDMLAYESGHLTSIIDSSGRGITWALGDYVDRVQSIAERWDMQNAESQYEENGNRMSLYYMTVYMDKRGFSDSVMYGVYDEDGEFVNATSSKYPVDAGTDESFGENIYLRGDENGGFWFVFRYISDIGIRYELAVSAQTVLGFTMNSARIGEYGSAFIMDSENQFFAFSTSGGDGLTVMSTKDFLAAYPDADGAVLDSLSEGLAAGEDYKVFSYPMPGNERGTDDVLVILSPLSGDAHGLVIGAAISFQEFSVMLTNTLGDIGLIILMEIAGAMLLFLLAAWLFTANRRNAVELAAVRERADLMEEINREQQSIAHADRLQQLGVMTSGIIHEVNNMLTPIMSQSMLLLEDLADDEESPEFEFALDIYEAAEKARDVLKRMNMMNKKADLREQQPLCLGPLLRRTMNLAAMARDPHIVQELEIPETPVYIRGSEQLLTQAVLNLCINACQAMGDTGTLTVRLTTEMRSGKEYARIDVLDTGPGVPDELHDTIFDAFVTTKGEHGTGLGLNICLKIVENCKGTISENNRPEGGADFTVRIPTCDTPEEEE